jgi:hypothetical protein
MNVWRITSIGDLTDVVVAIGSTAIGAAITALGDEDELR